MDINLTFAEIYLDLLIINIAKDLKLAKLSAHKVLP